MTDVQAAIDAAPLPTPRERRRRRNPFIQFGRFVALGWGMFRLAQH